MIVFGRFVPGLRFMVGATMGLTRYPYRRFLLWDVLGGILWAAYTCGFCYLVASIIQNKPLLSIAAEPSPESPDMGDDHLVSSA